MFLSKLRFRHLFKSNWRKPNVRQRRSFFSFGKQNAEEFKKKLSIALVKAKTTDLEDKKKFLDELMEQENWVLKEEMDHVTLKKYIDDHESISLVIPRVDGLIEMFLDKNNSHNQILLTCEYEDAFCIDTLTIIDKNDLSKTSFSYNLFPKEVRQALEAYLYHQGLNTEFLTIFKETMEFVDIKKREHALDSMKHFIED